MLTKNEKRRMSSKCGWSEEQRVDDIRIAIGNSKYNKDKENSLHRKMLKAVIDKIVFGKEIPTEILTEYMKYYEDIEKIKAKAKKEVSGA